MPLSRHPCIGIGPDADLQTERHSHVDASAVSGVLHPGPAHLPVVHPQLLGPMSTQRTGFPLVLGQLDEARKLPSGDAVEVAGIAFYSIYVDSFIRTNLGNL